jgi:hypothetical protein
VRVGKVAGVFAADECGTTQIKSEAIQFQSPEAGVPGARFVRWGKEGASENSPARQCRDMSKLS